MQTYEVLFAFDDDTKIEKIIAPDPTTAG